MKSIVKFFLWELEGGVFSASKINKKGNGCGVPLSIATQVGKLRLFFTWMFSMDWLDEYSYGEMLNISCLTGNFPLRSWSWRVYSAFYLNRCVLVVLTPGTVTHWILHLTVERSELLLTFSQHSQEQIFTLRKSTQIKKLKCYLV